MLGPGRLLLSGQRAYSVSNDGVISQNIQFGTFTATGYVTLGQAERLQMFLGVDAYASGQAQCLYCTGSTIGQGGASFQPRLTWNGITGARLFDKTPIDLSRLSATSDSGMNYATAVPESSSGLLLMLGLTAWFISRWRSFVKPIPGASCTAVC